MSIDKSKLEKLHYARPLMTNAAHNRNMAFKMHNRGYSVQEIAAHWPEVWEMTETGLRQKYDSVYNDCETLEIKYMISESSIPKKRKQKKAGN